MASIPLSPVEGTKEAPRRGVRSHPLRVSAWLVAQALRARGRRWVPGPAMNVFFGVAGEPVAPR